MSNWIITKMKKTQEQIATDILCALKCVWNLPMKSSLWKDRGVRLKPTTAEGDWYHHCPYVRYTVIVHRFITNI